MFPCGSTETIHNLPVEVELIRRNRTHFEKEVIGLQPFQQTYRAHRQFFSEIKKGRVKVDLLQKLPKQAVAGQSLPTRKIFGWDVQK